MALLHLFGLGVTISPTSSGQLAHKPGSTMASKRRSTLETSGRFSGFWFQHASVSFQTVGPSPRDSPSGGFCGRTPLDIMITTCVFVESGKGIFPVNTLQQGVDFVRVRMDRVRNL